MKRPLSFVPAQSILVIDPTENNVVQRAMRVSPFLTPHTPELVADSVKYYRKVLRRTQQTVPSDAHTLEQLFLLSGEARFVRALDSLRSVYSAALATDSLSRNAAQRLLNTLGWMAATEGRKLYINFKESCLIPINTSDLKVSIDQIAQEESMKLHHWSSCSRKWYTAHTFCSLSLPTHWCKSRARFPQWAPPSRPKVGMRISRDRSGMAQYGRVVLRTSC